MQRVAPAVRHNAENTPEAVNSDSAEGFIDGRLPNRFTPQFTIHHGEPVNLLSRPHRAPYRVDQDH
ncbi:MAG: hypothetical protein ACM3XM_11370 [Mycobacterium leprae]